MLWGSLWQLWGSFSWFRDEFGSPQGLTAAKIRKTLKNKEDKKEHLWIFACFRLPSLACTLAFLSRFPFLAINMTSSGHRENAYELQGTCKQVNQHSLL